MVMMIAEEEETKIIVYIRHTDIQYAQRQEAKPLRYITGLIPF